MHIGFTVEENTLKERVRKFAEEKLLPIADEVDESYDVSWDMIKLIRDEGLLRLWVPEKYGGLGLKTVNVCIVREELSRICIHADVFFAVQGMAIQPIPFYGTEEQRQKYLPYVVKGEKLFSFCLTEPEAGSDAAGIKTTATAAGDYYILNGTKRFISSVDETDIFIVCAKTDPSQRSKGITTFIVERPQEGIESKKMKILYPTPDGEIIFKNCRVPKQNILGELGKGLKVALANLDRLRQSVGAAAVGMGQRALDEALAYAKKRIAFGKSISEFQAIQFKLADMATQLEASRLLVYEAAARADLGDEQIAKLASMAKVFATEALQYIVDEALQIHGGIGLAKGMIVERLYRAAKSLLIYEGTSEIQRIVIARRLLQAG